MNSSTYAYMVDAKNAEIRDLKQKINDMTAKNVVADKDMTDDKIAPIKQGK